MKTFSYLVLSCFFMASFAFADGYDSFSAPASPNDGWNDVADGDTSEGTPLWAEVLLWFPNRVLDALDVFRVDLGAGGAVGGVARITPEGQMGYRYIDPATIRVGLFGRTAPVIVETKSEKGFGPDFQQSPDRTVCKGEVGIGLDLLIGGYAGICFDELLDFGAGIFLVDLSNDDMK